MGNGKAFLAMSISVVFVAFFLWFLISVLYMQISETLNYVPLSKRHCIEFREFKVDQLPVRCLAYYGLQKDSSVR